jgi:4-alpha-glucanotransferase
MEHFEKLFYWHGIADHYYNYKGDYVTVPFENKLQILAAMGVDIQNPEQTAHEAYRLDVAPWQNWLLGFSVVYQSSAQEFFLQVAPEALNETFCFSITQGERVLAQGECVPAAFPEVGDYVFEGVRYSRRAIAIGQLELGYHRIRVAQGAKTQDGVLVVAPQTAYLSEGLASHKKPWGVILQLYTLRSQRNWGIGDFTDLAFVIRQCAGLGVDMVGLNPLHALLEPVVDHCSPYSPSDRRFINPLYIDLEVEPDFRLDVAHLAADIAALRESDQVPYGAVEKLKFACFRQMFAVFLTADFAAGSSRGQEFSAYVQAQGEALEDFCLYQVSCELGQSMPVLEADKTAFVEAHREALQFHAYLQWLAQEQLARCQRLAKKLGMDIGLMRDLAVGANGGGAEVTSRLDLFCREASVGAPPDPLAEQGQNWGLPPMDPARLRLSQFAHFIDLLRRNMADCGALRIDHAMSLLRLWWCPPGKTADHGAYVYYPFHEMLALLKLESQLNRCVVIGEDMGVVPPELRQALYDGDIFTNKLFYFEKNHQGEFKAPEDYEAHSLAMLTNHDVPTLASWWSGSDIQLRESLKLFAEQTDSAQLLAQRQHEKSQLLQWLQGLGLSLPQAPEVLLAAPLDYALCSLILQGASRCRSQLFVVQLEDLELMELPVNVPGTFDQYPNWQRKLRMPIEALFADTHIRTLLKNLASARTA